MCEQMFLRYLHECNINNFLYTSRQTLRVGNEVNKRTEISNLLVPFSKSGCTSRHNVSFNCVALYNFIIKQINGQFCASCSGFEIRH